MRQRITHGATIDAATPAEVAHIFTESRESRQIEEHHREKGTIQLNAAGAGQGSLNVSSEYDWMCERVTLVANPAAAALVAFYESQQLPADLLEVIGLGGVGMYSDSFDNTMWVPSNSTLLIVVTGGTALGQLSYNIQVRMTEQPHKVDRNRRRNLRGVTP